MLVGDSPYLTEQATGHPFAGASGQLLDRILKRLSIDRSTLTITNSMLCSPPHLGFTDNPKRYPEALRALQQCEGYLQDTITKQQPKVIVCLGGVAMRQVIGVVADVTQRHSYVHETAYGIPAIPTFHPSYLLQNKHKLEICLMFALRRAQEVADGSYRESRYNLLLDPPIDAGYRYLNDHLRGSVNGRIDLLMVDIETPESSDLDEEDLEEKGLSYHIDRAGFSLDDHSGITFPFKQPYIDLLQEAINHADIISEWADNHFDSKRLRNAGLSLGNGNRLISGMWAWHFYQSDLLKGLGFVAPFFYAGPPWKHLSSSQPAIYNAYDQAIGRACTVGSMDKLAAEGRLDRFMRHCVDADRIYVQMGSMGVMIDTDHQSKFIGRLRVEYDQKVDEIQPLIPDDIKPIKLWKKIPKDMTGVTELPLPSTIIDGKMAKEMIAAARGTVSDREFKAAKAKINELRNPFRYKRVDKFNINSPIQMKDLIRSLGLKVPKDRDGETTGAKHLKRFSKYPIFHTILQAKQRGKLVSSYNWKVDNRGRVKTVYGFHPSTLRKSSRSYNLQVIPKRSDLADEFCKMMVAAPGHYLVASDASAIEAVLVGYDAGSTSYMRLSKAGLHGWMTSAYHGQHIPLSLDDGDLYKMCKAAKKKWPIDYEILKRIDHMSNYLATPYRIYEEYPEHFSSPIDAGKLQAFYFATDPGREIRQWQSRVMNEAHTKNYLDNHFQYRHYFYSVYKFDSKSKGWMIDHDGDAKRAVAFRPQSDACVSPQSLILKSDLTWVRADEINVGDELIAFDESADNRSGRRFKASTVLEVHKLTLPRVRVHTDKGTVIVSKEHPYLSERAAYRGKYWIKAGELTPGCRISYLAPPWDGDYSRDGGYLAGFFDGEGWCQKTRIGFGQNLGPTLDHVQGLLHSRGFNFNLSPAWRPGSRAIRPGLTQMRGELRTMRESLRFMGTIRPTRLLPLARQLWEGKRTGGKSGTPIARVFATVDDGIGDVIAIKTSTGTYISDGMFSHNSAIQTEVILRLAEGYEGMIDWMRLIIHDSIILEVPEDKVEMAATILHTEMTWPIPELPLKDGGLLAIGAETKFGRNLAAYNEETNPDGMQEMVIQQIKV